MTNTTDPTSSIERRIYALETDLRRVRRRCRAFASVLLLALGAIIVGFAQQPAEVAKEVRATAFVLEDGAGNVRATLSLHLEENDRALNGDPVLVMYRDVEEPGLVLGSNEFYSMLGLIGPDGETISKIGTYRGMSKLSLGGSLLSEIRLDVSGDSDELVFYGQNGDRRLELGMNNLLPKMIPVTGYRLQLYDETGKLRTVLGSVNTQNDAGVRTTYPESTLTLFGTDGKVSWQLTR